MPHTPVSVLLDGRSFLEGPRWHDGRLWVSDQYLHEVLAVDPASGEARVTTTVPGEPAGLGWLPDGRLLVASMRDRHLMRQEPGGELAVHADLSGFCGGSLNDLVVDAAGHTYVGNFGFDLMAGEEPKPTVLVRVEPDGTASVAAKDLMFPNGVVLADNGRTLVVAETFAFRLTAFTVAPDGSLGEQRVWADLSGGGSRAAALGDDDRPVAADGIALDAEGAIWVADAFHSRVLRVREGGEVVDVVDTGEETAYACALGGFDGHTLFVTTARSFLDDERAATRDAKVLVCQVDVPGA